VRLIKFTDLGGNSVYIVDTWVQCIKLPHGQFQGTNAKSVIVMSGYEEAIQEGLEQAVALLNGS